LPTTLHAVETWLGNVRYGSGADIGIRPESRPLAAHAPVGLLAVAVALRLDLLLELLLFLALKLALYARLAILRLGLGGDLPGHARRQILHRLPDRCARLFQPLRALLDVGPKSAAFLHGLALRARRRDRLIVALIALGGLLLGPLQLVFGPRQFGQGLIL
jgi:hypothetical protein